MSKAELMNDVVSGTEILHENRIHIYDSKESINDVVSGAGILPGNESQELSDNNGEKQEIESTTSLLRIGTVRILHDISGLATQLALNRGVLPELSNVVDDYISHFSLYRDFAYSLICKYKMERTRLIKFLEKVSISKRIEFNLEKIGSFSMPQDILLNLLWFAVELSPKTIEIDDDSLRVGLRQEIGVHEDIIKILKEYEKNPSPIHSQEKISVITSKNIFLSLFLNDLFEKKKKLSIKKIAENSISIAIV